jgi:hypothetical protein
MTSRVRRISVAGVLFLFLTLVASLVTQRAAHAAPPGPGESQQSIQSTSAHPGVQAPPTSSYYTWYKYGSFVSRSYCLEVGQTVGALPIVDNWGCSLNDQTGLWDLWVHANVGGCFAATNGAEIRSARAPNLPSC